MPTFNPVFGPVFGPGLVSLTSPPLGGGGGAAWTPALWFLSGEQGAAYWITPDFYGLYQDDAGVTPVTAVEQTVGYVLDRSGRGNHATQATAASRPKLTARKNLLLKTEELGSSPWTLTNVTTSKITQDGIVLNEIRETAGTGQHKAMNLYSGGPPVPTKVSFVVKANGRTKFYVGQYDGMAQWDVVDLAAGTMTSSVPQYTDRVVTPLGGGLYRVSFTTTGGWGSFTIALSNGSTDSYTGDGASGIYVGQLQLEAGTVATTYQRVTTATDYDTAGFPHRLKFDGVDDFLQTAAINFTATDKMTVVAGVTKLSDAAVAILAELSTNAGSNVGGFYVAAPENTGASGNFSMRVNGVGSSATPTITPTTLAPTSKVLTCLADMPADSSIMRLNGTQVSVGSQNLGTGNLGNYVFYVGRRAGTSLPANIELSSLVVRGAATADVTPGETFAANLHGVTL